MRRRGSNADLRLQTFNWRKLAAFCSIGIALLTLFAQIESGYNISQRKFFSNSQRGKGDYPSNGVRRRTQEWLIEIPKAAGKRSGSGSSDAALTVADSGAKSSESSIALLPLVEEEDNGDEVGSDGQMIDEFDGTLPIGSDSIRYPGVCRTTAAPLVPTLATHKIWRSKRQRVYSDVSIVTQLSIERLDMLRGQCGVWGSVISAAVHVPMINGKVILAPDNPGSKLNHTSLDSVISLIDSFHKDLDANARCKLDLVMLVEDIPNLESFGLYPVNALRNRALQLSRTELVFLLDADFLPNKELSADIKNPEKYATLRRVTLYKQAIVMPALETVEEGETGRLMALKAIENKTVVHALYQQKKVRGFHMDHFESGHGATDFDRWMTATLAYRVNYAEGYEPYVIVQRKFVPWYDERFKGYRKNKVVHLMNMYNSGMTFVASPKGYVIHSPHAQARSWEVTQSTGFWAKLKRLYFNTKDAIEKDQYVPATAFKCESRYPEKWSWYRKCSRKMLSLFLNDEQGDQI